ncbi:MAG: 3-oxoacyl-[acyl-carrier-protein] reductase [Oscillospiraceae bacterium]|nr:3-oxoacyl-[acyl-carrier-protein] reductase [Oscillospiraceae bacterium]
MTMTGKTALVTGGSRGIGKAICLELARRGANVVVNYAGNADGAEAVAAACRAMGVQSMTVQANVADSAACSDMVKQVVAQFERLDILVCNAGITRDNLALMIKDEDFDAVLDTNLKGAFYCMKAAYRPMMKQKYGRIVALSSVVGLRGNAGQANYAASKAGLIGMSKSFAKELAGRNVTINLVAPGFIETDMTDALPESAHAALNASVPMGHPGTPVDVANAVCFFAEASSGYITGQVLCVDGGMAV